MAVLGVGAVLDPDVADAAGLFGLLGLAFVPVIWVSIRPSTLRQTIQKSTVVGCLVLAFFGAFVVGDIVLPMILIPATTLLAVASGLIFQRSR